MGAVTADDIYHLIKQWESTFPLPAPYVTVDVGTFDAAAGTFQGLTTKVTTDPEPIEHGPHDTPRNPPPRFVGNLWEVITIDARWRQTIRRVPAPKVPLAPVLLHFTVKNATTSWSVTFGGFTTTAPAGQTTLSVSIWDRTTVDWTIQAGPTSYHDELLIQRPGGLPGFGAFTIPVIPVAIVYAPPVDSLAKSVATYGTADTMGTTVSYDFSMDSSETVPKMDIDFTAFTKFKGGLDVVSQVLSLASDKTLAAAGKALSAISTDLGTATQTEQTGNVQAQGTSITVTRTSSGNLNTNTSGGGPGVGDMFVFYRDVKVAWLCVNGQLQLCPFGHTLVTITAAKLHTTGIASDDQQRLLSLDPFVAGGPFASLPPDRFTVPDSGEVNLEYGGGVNVDQKLVKTTDTRTTTTTKTYTTDTSAWEPGPLLKLLGIGGDKHQVTTTQTNAITNDVASTVTLEANLFAGPNDHFAVTIWFDQLFGTWAFQQHEVASSPLVSGGGAKPGEKVKLEAGNRTYVTVADKDGHYTFKAKSIPAGAASLTVGSQPPRTITIAATPTPLALSLRISKKTLPSKSVQVTVEVVHAGHPVAGAKVSGLPGGPKTTDASGVAVFTAPAAEHRTFTVEAAKAGYAAARAQVSL